MSEKDIPTNEKIMIPLRISDELYKKVRNKVNEEKNKTRGYSINKYISELVENNIKVYEVNEEKLSLEDAFLKKTGGNTID